MSNQDAYKALTKAGCHWDRKDESHIILWTPGYITQEAHNVEKFLMQAGMRLVAQEFDRVCGKTYNVFKHKAGAQ